MSVDFISNPEEAKELIPRYKIFYLAIGFALVLFTGRLWYLQIIEGSELREFSEKNRIKQIKVLAPRGLILDREGKTLVENHPGMEAVFSPQYITNLDELAQNIAPLIGLDSKTVIQRFKRGKKLNGPFAPVVIKDNLSKDEVFRLKRIRLDNPGLEIRESIVRHYPLGTNGSQLFGYVAEISRKQIPIYNEKYRGIFTFEQGDIIGKNGLEEVMEKDVRGTDGVEFIQVDAFGRETISRNEKIYGEAISNKIPEPGHNAILTIDRDIQEAAYNSFVKNERVGALVAMKTNGEVLAWISSPSYDPNEFSKGISTQLWSKLINDPFKPLRNKVVQDHYYPGSTFKALVALAALQEKVIGPKTEVHSPGSLYFGRRRYHDHQRGGHGNVTVYEALERSSNVFFYKMGIALGIDKMYNYISQFGIGSKTGIESPREIPGLMPSSEWKKKAMGEEWQPGENLSVAIGQGFVQATPLQMAVAYNTIAQGGLVVKPFVIQKVVDQDGKVIRETEPSIIRDISDPNGPHPIKKEYFKVVKDALKRVVHGERGTARFLKIPGVTIAGKTGTSQVMSFSADQIYAKCEERPIHQRHHGWFIAWAPADNPEITVAALAEHSCHGSTGAGPLVRDTIRAYFEKHHSDLIAEAIKKASKSPPKPVESIVPQEGE